jgi:hypothetical protein
VRLKARVARSRRRDPCLRGDAFQALELAGLH